MTKKYASSVYSQKSATSAKSGRSYLSFTTGATIWPIFSNSKEQDVSPDSLNEAKQGIWKNLKNWIPSTTKKVDTDNFTIKSSSGSISSSSSSSFGKWKKILISPTQYVQQKSYKKSPVSSLQDTDANLTTSSIDTASFSDKGTTGYPPAPLLSHPIGILVNGGGSAEEIAEQKKRRRQRRLYLMRMQQPPSHRQSVSSIASSENATSNSSTVNNSNGRKRQVGFSDNVDSSSSSTLLSTPPDDTTRFDIDDKLVVVDDENTAITMDQSWYSAPRVMFVEPSPVPRFRNEPPAPPPSPPYLNVIVQPFNINNNNNNSAAETDENDNASSTRRHSLITDNEHSDIPTIFTTLPQQLYHGLDLRQQQQEEEQRRPRLVFTSPLHRGQTITFSLQNAIPDDHIIVYKFLTSNTKLFPRTRNKGYNSSNSYSYSSSATSTKDTLTSSSSSSWSTPSVLISGTSSTHPSASGLSTTTTTKSSLSSSTERYFVRPSAGRMISGETHSDIMLFLNQVPPLAPGEVLKDKILVRWAVIQRGTQVEEWVNQLKESTRRKWLEMLLENWPDQVVERKTRISIRFV